MSSNCWTSLFLFDRTTSFKHWCLFVKCTNHSMKYCYSQLKVFEVELQQNFDYQIDNSSLYSSAQCAVPMRLSSRNSFIKHQILIVYIFGPNIFAYKISFQSDNSFFVVAFYYSVYFKVSEILSKCLKMFRKEKLAVDTLLRIRLS